MHARKWATSACAVQDVAGSKAEEELGRSNRIRKVPAHLDNFDSGDHVRSCSSF